MTDRLLASPLFRRGRFQRKVVLALAHDSVMCGVAVFIALYLRIGMEFPGEYRLLLEVGAPIFMCISALILILMGVYRGIWAYVSMADLITLVKAATIAVILWVLVMFSVDRLATMPRSTPIILWLVLLPLLAGPRAAIRLLRDPRTLRPGRMGGKPVLILGAGADTELLMRTLMISDSAPFRPVGVLTRKPHLVGRQVHGVPILGEVAELEAVHARLQSRNHTPVALILSGAPEAFGARMLGDLLRRGRALGLQVARMPGLTDVEIVGSDKPFKLRPIALEDLLARPVADLDPGPVADLISGRRILVTGAGGTIGGELTRQIAALGPSSLCLADNSEFNLYSIDLAISETHPQLSRRAVLCDVADRAAVDALLAEARPDLIFHAAALKHVPVVELNPVAGVKANVLGTRHIADAAFEAGVSALVQVSTDKAVNPTNIMGATKRFAEFLCQDLDLRAGEVEAAHDRPATRFMTVRFGNVLGSSGSVVPLFRRQLERGGPLTVTHPEIRRYFMTVGEAVALILQAAAAGLQRDGERGSIFVLDMGEPVRVQDIARQIIQFSGQTPEIDVDIVYTGLRPGEKLYEELFDDTEDRTGSPVPGIMAARPQPLSPPLVQAALNRFEAAVSRHDPQGIRDILADVVPGFGTGRQRSQPAPKTNLKAVN